MNRFKKLSSFYVVWIGILIIIPLLLMMLLSVLDIQRFDFENASFSFNHFEYVFNSTNLKAALLSIKLGFLATAGALLLGYPIAYIVSNLKTKYKFFILLLFILPMWTNLLLRVEIINRILEPVGIMKNLFGISFDLSGSEFAVITAMILVYLPFMIFPIYNVLEKNDKKLIEASYDLGAGPIRSFVKVTLPMSLKGVFSGITMVFLPCAMGFTIPAIMSNGNMRLIGNIIEEYFKGSSGQFNVGSAISLILITIIFGALFITSKVDEEGEMLI